MYEEIEDLVNIGAYVAGANAEFDLAVQARPRIAQFLQQEPNAPSTFEQAKKQLTDLFNWVDQLEKALKAQSKAKK
jgi:flagellar biosynthesis/type III secretory pathway ATPase